MGDNLIRLILGADREPKREANGRTFSVEITIPMPAGLALKIGALTVSGKGYPTRRLQKGLILLQDGQELAEEGVGFGVPVLKRGLQTVFPGDIELASQRRDSVWQLTALFRLNLEEKIATPGRGSVKCKPLYAVKNSLAALIRRFPRLRGLLTATSNGLRRMLGWETTFEDAGFCTTVKMIYTVDSQTGTVEVEVDTSDLPTDNITEVVVMNEQGAHHFDRYLDSGGTFLRGKEIGCWDEVTAEEAAFISSAHRVAFTLERVKGARLFRGRELIGSRLAWSGFGYSFPPAVERFGYAVRIERVP